MSGCVWEVRPFHYKLKKEGFAPWLRGHGSHSSGSGWVESVASRVSPSVPCTWCPSHKQASVPAQSRKRRWLDDEDVAGRTTFAEHMATIGWILMYLLHYRCKKINQSERMSAHQLLCSVMSCALARRTLALSWHGARLELRDGHLHDESGIRALDTPLNSLRCWLHTHNDGIIKENDLQNAPLLANILWVACHALVTSDSTEAAGTEAGMVSLRGLTDCLVATVASELDAWARGTCTLDIPTATLLQTHLRG